jgi:hypothetical protein
MSHLTYLKNVFTRKDLLLEALRSFDVTIEEPGRIRYWNAHAVEASLVAKLKDYDLGFTLQELTADASAMIRDESEQLADFSGAARMVYVPTYDDWNGEVERKFGPNLCLLNQRYYELLLQEEAALQGGFVRVADTENEILVTLEV